MFASSRSHFAWVTLAYVTVIGLALYPGFHEGFGAKLMLWNCIPPTIAFVAVVAALGKSRRRFILSATLASLAAAVTVFFAAVWLFTLLDTDPHSSMTAIVFVFAPLWSLAIAMIGLGLVWFALRARSN
jgi:hypothetical protein